MKAPSTFPSHIQTIQPPECVVVPSLVLLFSFIYISISTFYFYEEADISIV